MKTSLEVKDMEAALRMAVPHMSKERFETFVRLCVKFDGARKREQKKEKQAITIRGNYDIVKNAINKLELDGISRVPEKPRLTLSVKKDAIPNLTTYLRDAGVEVVQ